VKEKKGPFPEKNKRLLPFGVSARRVPDAKKQEFFGSFFQKRTFFFVQRHPPRVLKITSIFGRTIRIPQY
jgi:hypothetical protein